ncbi:unnamed protein product [Camellia sinensis]
MANQQQISTRPWILEAVPLMVVVLIAAHVLALLLRSSLREERSTRTSSIYGNREVGIFNSTVVLMVYKVLIQGGGSISAFFMGGHFYVQ